MSKVQNSETLLPTIYPTSPGFTEVSINEIDQDIWATSQNMADIFKVSKQSVEQEILTIYSNNQLDRSETNKEFLLSQKIDDRWIKRRIPHYNLDVILAVGYRLNSKRAGDFMRWANSVLKEHIEQGYSLNYSKLENDPEALRSLAEEVRALRSSEKSTYAILRDCFKICASDYDGDSQKARSFFALLQDKFYHAITSMTASKIILDRANAENKDIGLVTFNSEIPTKEEVKVAKNYFENKELKELHLLSEAFLVLAESLISRGVKMTMKGLHKKIDEVLKLHEYDVFGGYEDYTRDEANAHALRERDNYIEILKLQTLELDTPFSLDAFYDGEYNDLKEITAQITLPQLKKYLPDITEKLHFISKSTLLE